VSISRSCDNPGRWTVWVRSSGLDLKTRDVPADGGYRAVEVTWRHLEARVETKRSREGGVSVRWSDKNLDCFTLRDI
jgi:hypothetical protein